MTYEKFDELFPEAMKKALPEEYQKYEFKWFMSGNGHKRFSLCMDRPTPEIVGADWYRLMTDNNKTLEEVAKYAADWFVEMVSTGPPADGFRKENIFPVFLGPKDIEAYKGIAPMKPFLDMTVGFRIIFNPNRKKNEALHTAVIPYSALETLGITEDELWRDCLKNYPGVMKPGYYNLNAAMNEVFGPPIYVVTNETGHYGAAGILVTDILEEIRKRIGCESLLLLPSSIHEILALDGSALDPAETQKMIKTVNYEAVPLEDRLSSHPYYYTECSIAAIEVATDEDLN